MKALSTGGRPLWSLQVKGDPGLASDSKRTLLRNRRAQHLTVCKALSAAARTLPAVPELLLSPPPFRAGCLAKCWLRGGAGAGALGSKPEPSPRA